MVEVIEHTEAHCNVREVKFGRVYEEMVVFVRGYTEIGAK